MNESQSNKKNLVFLTVGIAVGAAATVAGSLSVAKIVKEIKYDLKDTTFVSPEDNNRVTVKCGSSKFAKGMTFVKIIAENENCSCPMLLMILGRKSDRIGCEWQDNEHFTVYRIRNDKQKQICDAVFEENEITINHKVKKINIDQEG